MSSAKVKIIEDDSIIKKLEKTAKQLKKKYNKKRNINEKFLKKKPLYSRIISTTLSIVAAVTFIAAIMLGFSIVAARMQRTDPCFAGCTVMQIATHSMTASGFPKNTRIVVSSVNTDTLKPGDKIVFREYPPSYKGYRTKMKYYTKIDEETIADHESGLTLKLFFGIQSEEIKQASEYDLKHRGYAVFHHIRAVYEDSNGDRWFSTYGSSNPTDDQWLIHEDYVVGLYAENFFTRLLLKVITFLTNPMNLVISVMVPFLIINYFIVIACIKEIYYAKLELDIVEEKRKLTDEICVESGVGFRMDQETKYKVLAQASEDDKLIYIKLLWNDGGNKNSLKKYYLRKRLKIRPIEELCALNRECEAMFKNNVPQEEIAKYYNQKKIEIIKKQQKYNQKLKAIRRGYAKPNADSKA